MLDDWLASSLDADPVEPHEERSGKVPGGRYRLHAPGVLELLPDEFAPEAQACVVSAGIHGNETAPIELVGAWLARLEAGQLRLGAPVLVILGNLEAIRQGVRFCTTNLNRLFQRGLDLEGDEPERARELMAVVDAFFARHDLPRVHYDMHTAIRDSRYPRFAVEPFAAAETHPAQWHWLAAAGMQAALHQHRHSWTFSHYSKHYHAAQAFTLELGKVRPFGENDLDALSGMLMLLEAVLEGRPAPSRSLEDVRFFRVVSELMRQSQDFSLGFSEETPNFTEFAVGTLLAHDGQAGDTVVADAPVAVVFPNAQVELGARAALLVRACPPPA
ncbi:succinylglutamate desuccinylase [Chromohalobacter marismortui]|uniref:Succinylglutamate desuccinylase n=1 Tax=Chromohalobacter marismortui TaxID=42055 RepID=A0A4R7NN04_9GAMM|nr:MULTISPECIES: succinylglutamate desuccinylase [Chromohalobacter]MCI0510262.1 succinylglutamate desuccinylase [Chromohalobacter sp.]MCI0593438.1 succinylglutamate desuccinylase [Chromohalobacter sp.]TDU21680.1 succinylglutamate desuccinylase [Chromohalobacter marismortui]